LLLTPIFTANNRKAFTLIELIVVISLIGVMLFFTVPRLHQSFFTSDSRKFSTWLQLHVKELKNRAVESQVPFILYLDMDENRTWIGHEAMDEEAMETAKSKAMALSEGNRLVSVVYPGENRVSDGIAEIRFYPGGYSDRAVIYLETDEHQRLSYEIQSFLPRVRVDDDDVRF
jgi:general secretion pathway protein H